MLYVFTREIIMSLVPCLDCRLPCCEQNTPNIRLTKDIEAWGRIFPVCRCDKHNPDPSYLLWE
jgi:hypothetical protein